MITANVKGEPIVGHHVRLLKKTTRRWEPAVVSGVAGTPRSYYVKRLEGGEPLRRNLVDIRPTRETFQNFKRQSAINEEDEEVISAGPESMDTEVRNNDMCGNNVDDQIDITAAHLATSFCSHFVCGWSL